MVRLFMMITDVRIGSMTLLVRDFPKDVHQRLRAICALEGKSTREKLVELILEATKHLPAPTTPENEEPDQKSE